MSCADFLVLGQGPVVGCLEGTASAGVGGEASVLVLMVYGLLAVLEHPTTALAGVAALLPVDMLLVLVEHNVGNKRLATFVTSLPDPHVDSLYVLLQGKLDFSYASYKLLTAELANHLKKRLIKRKHF